MVETVRKLTDTEQQIIAYQQMGKPLAIRNLIATNNEGLIEWALNNTGYKYDNRRDLEEMRQEAYIILLEALDNWNNHNYAFTTYYRYKVLNMNRKTELYNQDTSLNTFVGEDEESELMDFIEDEESAAEFEAIEDKDQNNYIKKAISEVLSEKSCSLLFAKYGVNEEEKTYRELSEKYNVTGSYIRQIVEKAKRDLRNNYKIKMLWEEYSNIDGFRTSSLILYGGSKTNKVSRPVEEAVFDRLEKLKLIEEESKNRIMRLINESERMCKRTI